MSLATITCAGCDAEIPGTAKTCPHCNTPIGRSYKWRRGKKRLLATIIIIVLVGLATDAAIDHHEGRPLPQPHQVLDAPQ